MKIRNFMCLMCVFIVAIVMAVIFGLTVRHNITEHEFEWYASQSIAREIQNEYDDEIILELKEIKDWIYEWDYEGESNFKVYIATVYEVKDSPDTVKIDKWLCFMAYNKINGTGFEYAYYQFPDTDVIRLA